MSETLNWLGYFDSPDGPPAYDPPQDATCPVCLKAVVAPMVTHSLILPGDARSYFYRTHKACAEDVFDVDSAIIDARARARDGLRLKKQTEAKPQTIKRQPVRD